MLGRPASTVLLSKRSRTDWRRLFHKLVPGEKNNVNTSGVTVTLPRYQSIDERERRGDNFSRQVRLLRDPIGLARLQPAPAIS
jgi:hypothetical protein